jgi:hypothetical protein
MHNNIHLDFHITCNVQLLTKIRSGTLKLNVETGRYQNIVRENRTCISCNMNVLEDEYHFILLKISNLLHSSSLENHNCKYWSLIRSLITSREKLPGSCEIHRSLKPRLHNKSFTFEAHCLTKEQQMYLFDSMVGSVLGYASEIWGFHRARSIDFLHNRFCKINI